SPSMSLTPCTKKIVTCSGSNEFRSWDIRSHPLLGHLPRNLREGRSSSESFSIAYSPDGKTLAGASAQGVHVWDLAHGAHVRVIEGPESTDVRVLPGNVTFSPDGKLLAVSRN